MFISLLFINISWVWAWTWACSYDLDSTWTWNIIKDSLDQCLGDTTLVNPKTNLEVGSIDSFSVQVNWWINNISLYIWLLAVFAIVFWAFMLNFSWWEDEKVKKAKDIIKWSIIWFIWVILASGIANLIIKIMYSI